MPLAIPFPEQSRFVGNKTITGILTVNAPVGAASPSAFFTTTGSNSASIRLSGTDRSADIGNSVSGTGIAVSQLEISNNNALLRFQNANASTRFGDIIGIAAGQLGFSLQANGQVLGVKTLTELTTIAIAASTDTTIQLPASAIILAVSVRVTVVIPTAATFTVGDAGVADRFSTAAVTVAAGSTNPGTKAGAYYNASATAVRITPDIPVLADTGRVRVTIHYIDVTPATS